MEVIAKQLKVFFWKSSDILQRDMRGRVGIEGSLQVINLIIFFLIYFFKMVGGYKFPESFEQLVVVDGLEGEVRVADSKLDAG